MKFLIAFSLLLCMINLMPSVLLATTNSKNSVANSAISQNKKLTYKERVFLKHTYLEAKIANNVQFRRKLLIIGAALLIVGLVVVLRFNGLVSPNSNTNLTVREALREGIAYLLAIAALIVSGLLFIAALLLSIRR